MGPFAEGYKIRGFYDAEGNTVNLLFKTDAQVLRTRFFSRAWETYSNWSLFKALPHGKGTLRENNVTISIIRILTEEEQLWDRWEWDMRQNNRTSGRKGQPMDMR